MSTPSPAFSRTVAATWRRRVGSVARPGEGDHDPDRGGRPPGGRHPFEEDQRDPDRDPEGQVTEDDRHVDQGEHHGDADDEVPGDEHADHQGGQQARDDDGGG